MPTLFALLAVSTISALGAPLAQEPQPEPDRVQADLKLGVDIIGVWGLAGRVGYHGHHGWLDMVGLRVGYAAGPGPIFADERVLGAAFVAPTFDLFPHQVWQMEVTLGPAALDLDDGGDASLHFGDGWGYVASIAGRYKTEGAFQFNLGPMLLADYRFRGRIVVVDIGPSWVW